MDMYNPAHTPIGRNTEHIITFSSGSSSGSDSDLSSDLSEFIHDPNFTIPMLEDIMHRASGINRSYPNPISPSDPVSDMSPRYYLFDFALCMSVSFVISSITLMTNLLPVNIGSLMIIQTLLQTISLAGLLYIFATPDTYKSLNCSLEFLPINWVSYSYSLPNMLSYLGIQILATIIGAYTVIGMYYNKIDQMERRALFQSILPGDPYHALSVDSFVLTIFANLIMIVGATFIMNQINSINCSQSFAYAVSYILIVGLVYELFTGPINFILYKLILYGAIVSVFDDVHDSQKNPILIAMGINILFKLIVYPVVAYHVKYIWSQMLRRYIEYRA